MKLPSMANVMETLVAKQEAKDTVTGLIERNLELEEIFETLQPLLYELSVKLYADNTDPVGLNTLIEDAVKYLKGE